MFRSRTVVFCFCIALIVSSSVALSTDESTASRYLLSLKCIKLFARIAPDERYWTGNGLSRNTSLARGWVQVMRARFALARLQNWSEKPEDGSPTALKWSDVEKALESLKLIEGENAIQLHALVAIASLSEMSMDKTISLPSKAKHSDWLASIEAATSTMDVGQFSVDLCVAAEVEGNPDFANFILPVTERPGNFDELVNSRSKSSAEVPPGLLIFEIVEGKLANAFQEIDDRSAQRIKEMMADKNPKTREQEPPIVRPGDTGEDEKGSVNDEKKEKTIPPYLDAEEFLQQVEKLLGRALTEREAAFVLELAANEGYTVKKVVDCIRETEKIINPAKLAAPNGANVAQ